MALSKSDRLSFLKLRHTLLFGVALGANGLLPVSRGEISKEARAAKARVSDSMNDSTSEGDRIEAPAGATSLQFESIAENEQNEKDSAVLLSRAEKNQIRKELAEYRAIRASYGLANSPNSPLS